MSQSTAAAGARGGIATIASQICKLLLQVVSVSVLSRLLLPEDFGLIAMTAVFIQFGTLLRDFGMPTAAIQAPRLTPQQASNLFWLNTALGLLGAVLLLAATPLVVAFYNEPRLAGLMPVMASTLLLGGVSAQSRVQLARSFRFGAIAFIEVAAQVLGLVTAIICALYGLGFWALAWQAVVVALSIVLLQGIYSRWFPTFPKKGAGTKTIIRSGGNFGAAGLLNFFASNVDSLAIGSRWGAESLGGYNRASQLLSIPIQGMMIPLTNVVIPVANRARGQGRTIDSVLLRIQFVMGAATVWVYLIAFTTAPFLIPILLGDGWDFTIVLFQILAAGGLFHPFSFVSYWGFILHNKSRALLHYNLVTKTLTVVAVIVGASHSVEMAAVAYSASLAVSWPVNLIWLARSAKQDSWAFFRNGARIILSAAVAAAVALLIANQVGSETLGVAGTLALLAVLSTTVYLAVLALLPGGKREIRQAISLVRNIRK